MSPAAKRAAMLRYPTAPSTVFPHLFAASSAGQDGCMARYCRVLLICSVMAPALALADIYAFTDADGVEHFSNVPQDDRYQLVLASEKDQESAPKSAVSRALLASSAYDPIIEQAAASQQVESDLLRAVIAVESNFNARAKSPKGARGLMQLMPGTAQRYGASDIFDPSQNIHAGAGYLRDLLRRYENNMELALAAYNAGEKAVDRYGKQIPPFRETRDYVPKVLRFYRAFVQAPRA